jgi:RimJ/RimL family protein N-acetyltransferase
MDKRELPIPRLADAVVRLRPWRGEDVHALCEAVRDPAIPRHTHWPPDLTADEARERMARSERRRLAGERIELAVADPGSDKLIGFVGMQPEWDERRAHLFYWTASSARDRGVARHAVVLLSTWGFDELGIERLQLEADADNIASQRVAEACGFRREGVLRAHRRRDDGRCDSVIFGLVPGKRPAT